MLITVSKEYESILAQYDVLITPTVSTTASKLADRGAGLIAQWKTEQRISNNTCQFNLTGLPAMTIPVGFLPDQRGGDGSVLLPAGMQIVGPLHGEEKIFKVGYAFEKMVDWRKE
jgi:amidase